jgi:hypothetical protein
MSEGLPNKNLMSATGAVHWVISISPPRRGCGRKRGTRAESPFHWGIVPMGLSPISSRPELRHDRSTSPALERGRRSHSETSRAQPGQGLGEEQEPPADQESSTRQHPAKSPARRLGQGSGLNRRAICQGRPGSAPDPLTGGEGELGVLPLARRPLFAVRRGAPWWVFELGFEVSRTSFRPVPRVDAAVLTIRRREPGVLPEWLAPEMRHPPPTGRRSTVHQAPVKESKSSVSGRTGAGNSAT